MKENIIFVMKVKGGIMQELNLQPMDVVVLSYEIKNRPENPACFVEQETGEMNSLGENLQGETTNSVSLGSTY